MKTLAKFKRKAHKVNTSSLSLILPRQWADAHKIEAKDNLVVSVLDDGNLLVEVKNEN